MSKFIYSTKDIMSSAWELARRRAAVSKRKFNTAVSLSEKNGTPRPVRGPLTAKQHLPLALCEIWSEAKSVMAKTVAAEKIKNDQISKKESVKKRYVEFLSVAVRDNLNHGRAWRVDSDQCAALGFHPADEGSLICYVYPD